LIKSFKSNKKASLKVIGIIIVLVLVIAVIGLAFYYYNAYHKLTFQLNSVSLGSASLSSVQLNVALGISNPNLLPVFIPSGEFTIYINNQRIGAGTFGSVTVGGNSQSQLLVPVTLNASDVPSVLYGVITGGGSVTVTVQGSANLVLFSVPFNETIYNVKIG